MWGLINTLQMIVIIVLFNVQFPLNCAKILIDIMSLANLDIIDVDDYIVALFDFQLDSPPFNEIFEEAGFESSTFTIELGLIFFVIVFSIVSALVKLSCKRATMGCELNCLTKSLRKPVNTIVVIVRFLMESCNEMGLAALITISVAGSERWSRFSESIDLFLAWVLLVCLATAPLIVYY